MTTLLQHVSKLLPDVSHADQATYCLLETQLISLISLSFSDNDVHYYSPACEDNVQTSSQLDIAGRSHELRAGEPSRYTSSNEGETLDIDETYNSDIYEI